MYHYVRDPEKTKYPGIKARRIKEFENQLEYIKSNYYVLSPAEFISVIKDKTKLPRNSALLTFDDGYIDHYVNVFPLLERYKLKAYFGPVVKSSLDGKVLDVNKIHFILSVMENKIDLLIERIFSLIDEYRETFDLESNEFYFRKLAVPSRFDSAEVIFVKRLLQRELPETLRNELTTKLFKEYVSSDEEGFARELYLQPHHLKQLAQADMGIMGHGYEHYWLDSVDTETQKKEVFITKTFLNELTNKSEDFVFCYPYGNWNASLIEILKTNKFIAGFTTEVRVANPEDNPFILPRLDTNDLPH